MNNPNSEWQEEVEVKKTCFFVFSSREVSVSKTIDRLTDYFENELKFRTIRLDREKTPGETLLQEILKWTKNADLVVVVLDGLRPNILLETGMAMAFGTPMILLLQDGSCLDLPSLCVDVKKRCPAGLRVPIDISKHVSDISNVAWTSYEDPTDLKFLGLLRKEVSKVLPTIKNRKTLGISPIAKKLFKKIDDGALLEEKKFERVVSSVLRDAIKTKVGLRESVHLNFHIGLAYDRRGQLLQALKFVSYIRNILNESAEIVGFKGYLLRKLGQLNESISLFSRSMARHSEDGTFIAQYCIALLKANQPRKALSLFKMKPYEWMLENDLFSLRAEANFQSGLVYKAITEYLEIYENTADGKAIRRIIAISAMAKWTSDLYRISRRIKQNISRAIDRSQIKCVDCFLRFCEASSSPDLLEKYVEKAWQEIKSTDPIHINNLAFELIAYKRFEQSTRLLKFGVKKFPKHPYLQATLGLLHYRADAAIASGDRCYKKAITLTADKHNFLKMWHIQRGIAFLSLNKKKLAKKELVAAREISSSDKSVITEFLKLNRALSS